LLVEPPDVKSSLLLHFKEMAHLIAVM